MVDFLIKALALALTAGCAFVVLGSALTGQSVKRDGSSREGRR